MTTHSPGSEPEAAGPPPGAVLACLITVAVAGWAIPFGGLALALLYALTGLRRHRVGILLMLLVGAGFALNAAHVLATEPNRLPASPAGPASPASPASPAGTGLPGP